MGQRRYHTPYLSTYRPFSEIPPHLLPAAEQLLAHVGAITTVVNRNRHLVSVSDRFAEMLGYQSEEFNGKRIDDITTPGTVDIDFAFESHYRLGESEGIWIFNHHNGSKVVANFHARTLDGYSIAAFRPLLQIAI